MKGQPERWVSILMVEDNPSDVVFFEEACRASKTAAKVQVVTNGAEALRFLRQESPFNLAPRPDVVVLDLNLPLMSGQELIVAMNSDPALNTLPVAILTTSTSEPHLCRQYSNGRCLYFTKTDDFKRMQFVVKQIAAHAKTSVRG